MSDQMLVNLFEKIQASQDARVVEVDGRKYIDGSVSELSLAMPGVLQVSNLSTLAEYFKKWSEKDVRRAAPGDSPLLVHVVSPLCARVLSALKGDFEQRACYLEAKESFCWTKAGQWMALEEFNIMLLSQFVQDDATAGVMKLVGNIEDSTVAKFADDGVTQKVTATVGIVRKEDVPVPLRIILKPFRSFVEADQAPSEFILRLRSGQGQAPPSAALFEADGGAWKNVAMGNVKAYLASNLPEGTVILA